MTTEEILTLLPQPLGVYITFGVGVLLLIANVAPKFVPFGKAINKWFKSRRVEQRSVYDQRIKDRDDRIEELVTEGERKDQRFARYRLVVADREERWRREWHAHMGWDFEMINLAYHLGADPPPMPAPKFMTPDSYPNPNSIYSSNPEEDNHG